MVTGANLCITEGFYQLTSKVIYFQPYFCNRCQIKADMSLCIKGIGIVCLQLCYRWGLDIFHLLQERIFDVHVLSSLAFGS